MPTEKIKLPMIVVQNMTMIPGGHLQLNTATEAAKKVIELKMAIKKSFLPLNIAVKQENHSL